MTFSPRGGRSESLHQYCDIPDQIKIESMTDLTFKGPVTLNISGFLRFIENLVVYLNVTFPSNFLNRLHIIPLQQRVDIKLSFVVSVYINE